MQRLGLRAPTSANLEPVFTKLASQLTAEKLADLAVIPVIFVVQTLISYIAALLVSRICRFNKRASNFVVAMAVCLFSLSRQAAQADITRYSETQTRFQSLSLSRSPKHCPVYIGTRSLAITTTTLARVVSSTSLSSNNLVSSCDGHGASMCFWHLPVRTKTMTVAQ